MFNWIKNLFTTDYDFSQWDKGNFPLGYPDMGTSADYTGGDHIMMDDNYTYIISPRAARLIRGNDWPQTVAVDENLKPPMFSGKYMKPSAMYTLLFGEGGLLAERSVSPDEV